MDWQICPFYSKQRPWSERIRQFHKRCRKLKGIHMDIHQGNWIHMDIVIHKLLDHDHNQIDIEYHHHSCEHNKQMYQCKVLHNVHLVERLYTLDWLPKPHMR